MHVFLLTYISSEPILYELGTTNMNFLLKQRRSSFIHRTFGVWSSTGEYIIILQVTMLLR